LPESREHFVSCNRKKQKSSLKQKKRLPKNYNPAIRSIAPSRIPNMDVDADNIPKTIYPTIIPIFSGM
jgi:hypothetical protein